MLVLNDFKNVSDRKSLLNVLRSKIPEELFNDVMSSVYYEEDLLKLQAELVDFQKWVTKEGRRVCIIFEGRDAAGKGGAIRRFTEHLNPRSMRVVALTKPTTVEKGQWYFRRYIKVLPDPGEIVFFDRSCPISN